MRNLKRVLSLTLASVMLLGMMVIGSSAAEAKKIDFTDANEIEYTEAVDVMVALGVLEGNPNGDFNPKGSLTREQAAKIICYMLLGEANAEKLSANKAIFTDVAADRWSAGYISYCVERNILAGNGNGSFNPTGELTGVAFGKMLLVALGYDPTIQQYTGASWAISVAADMVDAGIAPAGVLLNAPLTREQAAQTAFQTLTADVVNYASRGTHVTSSDGTTVVVNASKPEAVTNRTADDYRTKVADRDDKQQFCEKYFSDLKKASDTDDFGRNGGMWRLKNADIVFSADEADATYIEEVKAKDLYSDLSLKATTDATVIVDGGDPTTFKIQKSSSTALPDSGNGVLVEAYVDDEDNVTLIVVNTYVGKISKVTAAKDNDARYVTVNSLNYDTESFAKDDVVIYTKADGEIQTMALADVVDGVTVTRRSGTSNFTAGGETYKYNKLQKNTVETDVKVGSVLDLYLDANGYVVKVDVSKSTTDFAFVIDVGDEGRYTSKTYYAKLLLTDGTEVEAELDKDNCKAANGSSITLSSNIGDLKEHIVEYTKDSKDVYSLTIKSSNKLAQVTTTGNKIEIEKGKAAMILNGTGTTAYADSKTVFMVKNGDNWTAYTGYANVPTLKKTAGAGDPAGYFTVYVDGTIAKVVVVTDVAAESNDVVYVLASKAGTLVREEGKDNYYEYKAVVNGEITTVKAKARVGGDTGTNKSGTDQLYKTIVYSNEEQEVIDFANSTKYTGSGDNYAVTDAVTKKFENTTLGIAGANYAVADDVMVFAVTAGDKIEDGDMDDATVGTNVTAVVKDGKIVTLFYGVTASSSSTGDGSVKTNILAVLNITDATTGTVTFYASGVAIEDASADDLIAAVKTAAATAAGKTEDKVVVEKLPGMNFKVSVDGGSAILYSETGSAALPGVPDPDKAVEIIGGSGMSEADQTKWENLATSSYVSNGATFTPQADGKIKITGISWSSDFTVSVPQFDWAGNLAACYPTAAARTGAKWAVVPFVTADQQNILWKIVFTDEDGKFYNSDNTEISSATWTWTEGGNAQFIITTER